MDKSRKVQEIENTNQGENMHFVRFDSCIEKDLQALLDSFDDTEERKQLKLKLNYRNDSSFIIFDDTEVIGYALGYEYDGKSKIELYVNREPEYSELLELAGEINTHYINPADKDFFIIEEADSSVNILNKFKFIDSNHTYELSTPLIIKKSPEIPYEFKQEKVEPAEYAELMKKCFIDDKEWDYTNYREQAQEFLEEESVTWTCRDNEKLIGACSICNDEEIYIDMLCIHPEYQKKGIGYKLMEKSLYDRDDSKVRLDVKSKNEKAIRFYENSGFKRINTSYIVVKKMEIRNS